MSISVSCISLDSLCKDYEFKIDDVDKLVELVSCLCLGQYKHVTKVIRALSPESPAPDEMGIRYLISVLDTTGKGEEYRNNIHGWLFQMMSWIALAEQHKDDCFLQHYPHSQPAMQGVDGIAITLKDDGGIERIIITEDKCTEHPRKTIRELVWPEFDDMENGAKNSAISQQIQSLFSDEESYRSIQNDVADKKYRQYRIGITREKCHESVNGRKGLFKNYEIHVSGDDVSRRTGASIYLDDMRNWMEVLRCKVISKLEDELNKTCTIPSRKT